MMILVSSITDQLSTSYLEAIQKWINVIGSHFFHLNNFLIFQLQLSYKNILVAGI